MIEPTIVVPAPVILIAEDNEVNQKVIRIILTKWGVPFEFAVNGEEVLQKLATASFGLILMDCQMPKLDGLQTTIRIRQLEGETKQRRIPIVAMTANAMKGDREKCIAAGMDDFIPKPFRSQELKDKVSEWLNQGVLSGKKAI